MNKRRGGLVLIAFGLIIAMLVGFTVFRMTQQATAQKVDTVDVVVALQDIPERTVIQAGVVGVRQVPADMKPQGAYDRVEQVVGQMATTRLYQGEPIVQGRLADTSGRSGVAYQIQKGKVLISLPASDIIGVGAVRPGDHIDLLATVLPPDQSSQGSGRQTTVDDELMPYTTQTTIQNLIVVGIGPLVSGPPATAAGKEGQAPATSNANPAQANLVTFAVNREDSLRLKLMKDHKRVKLEVVLRAAGDEAEVKTDPVTLQTIFDKYSVKAKPR